MPKTTIVAAEITRPSLMIAIFPTLLADCRLDDERYEKYSQCLAKLRGIRRYVYRMDVLERTLSYDEVTEIFVRVNSLGAKLR
jgi:hypothetical protein